MLAAKMVRISSKGQIVLPKTYRDKMGVSDGDYVLIQEVGDGVVLLERPAVRFLDTITADVRRRAAESGLTRADLDKAIHRIRSERR